MEPSSPRRKTKLKLPTSDHHRTVSESRRENTLPGTLASEISSQLTADGGTAVTEAIDDSEDADDKLVEAQRKVTQVRLEHHNAAGRLLHELIPFHWAPMLTPLTESDVEACVALEMTAVPDSTQLNMRDYKEAWPKNMAEQLGAMMKWRINKFGDLCYGFFNSCRSQDAKDFRTETMLHGRAVETGRESGEKLVMFAHIIATLCTDPGRLGTTDFRLDTPWYETKNFRLKDGKKFARTIFLHSLTVCPEVHGVGVGTTVMRSYIELMRQSEVAERIALICRLPLVSYFERFGFKDVGESTFDTAGYGVGGKWRDMLLDISRRKKTDGDKE